MKQAITIKQGDAYTLVETITGLASLTGYTAKMYVVDKAKTAIATITGTIDGLEISYEILNEDSKAFPVGIHDFETKIFDSSDHVYTPSDGKFIVEASLENDPS